MKRDRRQHRLAYPEVKSRISNVNLARSSGGFTLPTAVLLDAYDSVAGIGGVGNRLVTLDTVNKLKGANTVLVDCQDTSNGVIQRTVTMPADPGVLLMATRVVRSPLAYLYENFDTIQSGNQSGSQPVSNYARDSVGPGWLYTSRHVDELYYYGARLVAGGATFRRTFYQKSPFGAQFGAGPIIARAAAKPILCFTCDDGWDITLLWDYCRARGVPLTFFMPTELFGQNGKWTKAALKATTDPVHGAARCAVGLDATKNDVFITTYSTVGAAVTALSGERDMMIGEGFDADDLLYYCLPNGVSWGLPNSDQLPISDVTATFSGADLTFSAVPIRAVQIGDKFYSQTSRGTLTVLNVADPTHVTLDASPGFTGARGVAFVKEDVPFSYDQFSAATKAAGFKGARASACYDLTFPYRYGVGDQQMYIQSNGTSSLTTANFKANLDLTVLRGGASVHTLHGIKTGGSQFLTVGMDVAAPCVDLAVQYRDAGLLDIVTFPELLRRIAVGEATPFPV